MVDAVQNKKGVSHPAIQVVVGKYGIPTTVVNTLQGLVDIGINDWVVTFLGQGHVVMKQAVFQNIFEEWHETPNRQGEPERASSGGLPPSPWVPHGAAPPVQVEPGGLLRPVRPDSPTPDQGGAAGASQVQPVPQESPRADTVVPSPAWGNPGGVGVGGQGGLAVPPPIIPGGYEAKDPHEYKQKAIKLQAEQDNFEARVKAGTEAEKMRRALAGLDWTPEQKERYRALMAIAEPPK